VRVADEHPEYPVGLAVGPGVGSRVAGYRLERQIGAGGMAVVYLARDERLGRPVALKVMAQAMAADETFRLRFIRESRAAAAVDDPHIIPVYEAGEADGVLFIAIRFVSGGDVGSLLRREGPLPAARVAGIISSVASALDAAHAAGLVHRDVKPANMLLDSRPGRPDHVYLSDFGISKGMQSGGLTGSGHFLGTPNYTAPEQITGQSVDGRTDQYALACAAFELLAGQVPFADREGWAAIWAQMNDPTPTLTDHRPDLPYAVNEVFAKAMAKAPGHRYGSCQQFSDALGGALGLVSHPLGLASYYRGPDAESAAAGPAAPGRETSESSAATITTGGRPSASTSPSGMRRRTRPLRRNRYVPAALAVTAVVAGAAVVASVLVKPAGHGHAASPAPYSRMRAFTAPRPAGLWPFVSTVTFSPDGKTLATGLTTKTAGTPGNSGTTVLWDVRTGKQLRSLPAGGGPQAFSPDGILAAAGGYGDSRTTLWDPVTGKKIALLDDHQEAVINGEAFSPDGKVLATSESDGVVQLWNTLTRKPPQPLGGELTSVSTCVAFLPDNRTIVTGEDNDRVILWNRFTRHRIAALQGTGSTNITSVTVSRNGHVIAASDQNGRIFLWNLATGARTIVTDPHSYGVDAVAFSRDGTMLAAGDSNGRIYLWNLSAGKLTARKPVATLVNPGGPVTSLLTGENRTAVFSVAFSPDGKTLVTSDTNGSAYLWRVR
jgi:serine/threonine-protein kinase